MIAGDAANRHRREFVTVAFVAPKVDAWNSPEFIGTKGKSQAPQPLHVLPRDGSGNIQQRFLRTRCGHNDLFYPISADIVRYGGGWNGLAKKR
jgi:hypothetical protein